MNRKFLARRGSAFAVVAVLHVVALVVLVHARVRADTAPQVAVMHVDFITAEVPREIPRQVPSDLAPMPVQVMMPVVDIPATRVADTHAITVSAMPAPVTAPAPPSGPPGEPVMLSSEQVDYLRRPMPHYPRAARQARIQGTVLVWVLIGEDGRPREVRVHRSSGHVQLDREGCDAVREALFRPWVQQGSPRRAQVIVPVEFLLHIQASR